MSLYHTWVYDFVSLFMNSPKWTEYKDKRCKQTCYDHEMSRANYHESLKGLQQAIKENRETARFEFFAFHRNALPYERLDDNQICQVFRDEANGKGAVMCQYKKSPNGATDTFVVEYVKGKI